eukprot:TRINITY_DN330_c0_g1_i3.p1 TRINITY_DN330_c0_g1~~TRINITY_DN330_c0_g1_i3.p1  ORF type:complete len:369 (+),score=131.66 TRINITY_DN330_c0_g1_i3:175-1281(+)
MVVDGAKALVAASASLAYAMSTNNQDEIGKAAKAVETLTAALLSDTVGVHKLTTKPGVHDKLNKAVIATAKSAEVLLGTAAAFVAADDSKRAFTKAAFDKAMNDLAMTLHNIGDGIKFYPGGEALVMEEAIKESEELEVAVLKEIQKCTQQIEAGAAQLQALKPKTAAKPAGAKVEQADVSVIIRDGSREIANASAKLMKLTTVTQETRIQLLKTGSVKYRPDKMWSNALIGAAQAVSKAVAQLVGASMKPQLVEDELVGTAGAVASATANLVNAASAKTEDPNSQERQNLSEAAKAVAAATSQLISAAKKALEPVEEEGTHSSVSLTGMASQFDWEIAQQIKLEQLEKQLRNARSQAAQFQQAKTKK